MKKKSHTHIYTKEEEIDITHYIKYEGCDQPGALSAGKSEQPQVRGQGGDRRRPPSAHKARVAGGEEQPH